MSKTKTRKASKGGASQRPAKDDTTPKVMGFGLFRKHQKTMLWAAVIFTVLVFGLFASMSDIDSFLKGGGPTGPFARFVTASGETVELTESDYRRVKDQLGRLYYPRTNFSVDDVWTHLMLVADARSAGLRVSDEDLRRALQPALAGASSADYRAMVQSRGFTSTRDFEAILREDLLKQRYLDIVLRDSAIVDSEAVYLRWRIDNELFSYEALVFEDEPLESIPAPNADELQAFWDEMPEKQRGRTYIDPARQDIVLASVLLDHDLTTLPAEKTAGLVEPQEAEVRSRFNLTRTVRFPDVEEMTDAIAAELASEVKLIRYMQSAFRQFNEREAEAKTKAAFVEVAAEYGLPVVDPEGLLGPDEQVALPEVGNENLGRLSRLGTTGAIRLNTPYNQEKHLQLVFYENHTDAVPLDFDGARDQLIDDLKAEQQDRKAVAFREALRERARSVPEAREQIAPLEAVAAEEAAARIAALLETEDAEFDEAAIAEEELAKMEPAIEAILAEHEAAAWDALVAAGEAQGEHLVFTDVPRSYIMAPDDEQEAADSVERFLKTSVQVFAQDVDTVSPILRHYAGNLSAVVRITGRAMPDQAAMYADPGGMAASRAAAMQEARRAALFDTADPELLKASHELQLAEPEEAPADA